MSAAPVILWYRDDFRLSDHAPLRAAVASGAPIIPLFVLDDETPGPWRLGGASRWWLHHSLAALAVDLSARGGRLVIRRGNAFAVISQLARECQAQALYCHRGYTPAEADLERRLWRELGDSLEVRRFRGRLLLEPEQVKTGAGEPFKVFTPFWRACLSLPEPEAPAPAPERLTPPPPEVTGLDLDDLALLPRTPDWAGGLRENWRPGEAGAWERLTAFLDAAVLGYAADRDLPGHPGTSRLSPHLHFGEISPRQVWHAVRGLQAGCAAATKGGDAFLREVGWREFCQHLLHHWPRLPTEPFNSRFAHFPWREDEAALGAWRRGQTGYPLVDAGMRELWHTGWMHNRVRMVVASFLVKHLLVPWQRGQDWFWDTLVDADLANNAGSWQWVAGCGADAAPYFRIFNPVLQGQKFDARGDYVRRWVPELRRLPDQALHAPFAAGKASLAAAGVRLGVDYPAPLVEHDFARQRALAALATIGRPS
jgi:deoxyribodipyrimidine photo-lyase